MLNATKVHLGKGNKPSNNFLDRFKIKNSNPNFRKDFALGFTMQILI